MNGSSVLYLVSFMMMFWSFSALEWVMKYLVASELNVTKNDRGVMNFRLRAA